MSDIRLPRMPLPVIGHVTVVVGRKMLVWGGYTTVEQMIEEEGLMFQMNPYVDPALIWIYDPECLKWQALNSTGDIPLGTSGAGGVVIDSALYVFGGFNQFGNTSDLYRLDLKSLQWTFIDCPERSTQPSPRDKFMCWTHDDKFYVFGGFGLPIHGYMSDNGGFIQDDDLVEPSSRGWNNQLFVHDVTSEKTWTNPKCTGSVPTARAAAATAKIGHLLYLFGGRHMRRRLNDLYVLDLRTLEWTKLHTSATSSVPCGRSWHTFTPISDSVILLYGGYTQDQRTLNDLWALDTRRLDWLLIQRDPEPPSRLWHTMCMTESRDIVVFGGCSNNINSNHAKCHNEVFIFHFQPQSLLRLSLNAVHTYRHLFEEDLVNLPKVLHQKLLRRLPQPSRPEQQQHTDGTEVDDPDDPGQARTCTLS